MDTPVWIIGTLGLAAIELSYVPQVMRLAQRKRADDVSALFPALNLAGRVCAMTYAFSRGDGVFTIGFIVGAVLRATLLTQVLYYRQKRGSQPQRTLAPPGLVAATAEARS